MTEDGLIRDYWKDSRYISEFTVLWYY